MSTLPYIGNISRFEVEVSEIVEQARPDLWSCCYPRIYEAARCGSYYSPKTAARQMMSIALKIEAGYIGQIEQTEMSWACRLAQYRVPLFWIGRDMAEAIKQTVPPMAFDWLNEHLPFDGIVFMIPKGALKHETESEGEATFVSFVRTKQRQTLPTIAKSGPHTWEIINDCFSVFAHTSGGHLIHWNFPHKYYPLAELGKLDEQLRTFDDPKFQHLSGLPMQLEMTHEDNRFMARVTHMVFGTLILMLARPDLVTTQRLLKRIQKRGERPREFWSPNVIGDTYKIRRVPISLGGAHASPRWHWVHGFYKPRLAERVGHPVWVEPYERGARAHE
jgi:hypothetical protein